MLSCSKESILWTIYNTRALYLIRESLRILHKKLLGDIEHIRHSTSLIDIYKNIYCIIIHCVIIMYYYFLSFQRSILTNITQQIVAA